MGLLRVWLLGSVRIAHGDRPPETRICHSVQTLLSYLLIHRQRLHHREVLLGVFWGDYSEDRARSCLSTALWRLRRVLEPDGVARGAYLVTRPSGELGFNSESDHWLDVAVLEESAGRLIKQLPAHVSAAQVRELEAALQLYRGELLEGFYHDWVLRERERLHVLYLSALCWLMRCCWEGGAYDQSAAYGRQILLHDPLRESVHRDLMRLYLTMGQRDLALRQYQACRETLAAEFGVSPSEETHALYLEATSNGRRSPQPDSSGRDLDVLKDALASLQQAVRAMDRARQQLQAAVQLADRQVGVVE